MTFQNANKNVQMLTMKIDNINIEQVKEFNFLGLIIYTNLNLKRHIEKMSNACSNNTGIKQNKTRYLNKLKRYRIH